MDEIKNMLDNKVGDYIKYNEISPSNNYIIHVYKMKIFPNGNMDKWKTRLVTGGSQQGWHLPQSIN